MKTNILVSVLICLVLILAAGMGAYRLLPALISEATVPLGERIRKGEDRLQKVEAYVADREKAAREGQLKGDADSQAIIQALNRQTKRIDALEAAAAGEAKRVNGELEKLADRLDRGAKEQAEAAKRIDGEARAFSRTTRFKSRVERIKGQILKARLEISEKNIGNARNELDLIDGYFEKALSAASEQEKGRWNELRETLRRARADMETNLSSAANRLDLLWHELDRLPEKP